MTRRLLIESLDLLAFARRALSGPCCRFEPSCSAYAREALGRLPLPRAAALVLARVLRCHPLHPGGWDPVPGNLEVEMLTQTSQVFDLKISGVSVNNSRCYRQHNEAPHQLANMPRRSEAEPR